MIKDKMGINSAHAMPSRASTRHDSLERHKTAVNVRDHGEPHHDHRAPRAPYVASVARVVTAPRASPFRLPIARMIVTTAMALTLADAAKATPAAEGPAIATSAASAQVAETAEAARPG